MYESNDYEHIKYKEKEFIMLYKDTLCNLTEGGDSAPKICLKEVYKYSLDGNFICKYKSAAEAARESKLSTSSLNRCLMGQRKSNNLGDYQ